MTSLDERVAYLEGKVDEHSRGFRELRDVITHRTNERNRRFGLVARRLTTIDQRFAARDRGCAAIDCLFDQVDQRFSASDLRFDGTVLHCQTLDEKTSRHSLCLVGLQVALLLAVIGVLLGS